MLIVVNGSPSLPSRRVILWPLWKFAQQRGQGMPRGSGIAIRSPTAWIMDEHPASVLGPLRRSAVATMQNRPPHQSVSSAGARFSVARPVSSPLRRKRFWHGVYTRCRLSALCAWWVVLFRLSGPLRKTISGWRAVPVYGGMVSVPTQKAPTTLSNVGAF